MNKGVIAVSKGIKRIAKNLSVHSPAVLTGIGIAGMVGTVVLAVKSTPAALSLIDEAQYTHDRALESDGYNYDPIYPELSLLQKAKACWKCYVPAFAIGCASIACLIGANTVNSKRNAALAAAYEITRSQFHDYRESVVDEIGEKKERVAKEKAVEKSVKENPPKENTIIVTGQGEALCYDRVIGRYFESSPDKIRHAVNIINQRMIGGTEMYISLNELYDELNLPHVSIGDDLGWNLNTGTVEVDFSAHLAEGERPCVAIDYAVEPQFDYRRLY